MPGRGLSPPPDPPSLAGVGAGLGPDDAAAAVRADQRRRWRAGHRVPLEAYLAARPELGEDPSVLLDLVYSEYMLAEELGVAAPPAAYVGRFPRVADRLAEQLEVHRVLATLSVGTGAGPGSTAPTAPPRGDGALPAIPGYEVLGELGRGGMGVVYLARQAGLNRLVALKVVLAGAHAGPAERARFQAEAEAIARLKHPHIVQVYETGAHDGTPFISLEYCPGGSLATWLDGTPLPPRAAAELVEMLGGGLDAAHRAGIVHRDLKPANVLLMPDDAAAAHAPTVANPLAAFLPKVTDFGLAKRLDAADGATQTGAVLGTPSYMAPEQATGTKDLGPGADVYSLGAILYELLTGRPPFKAASILETLELVRTTDPVAARALQPGVPRDLDTVCLKCLQKDPARRYASAGELADDLRRFLSGRPILARPVGRAERLWRWARRNPAVAAMTASVLLLLVLLAAGASVAAVWLDRERVRAVTAEREGRDKLWEAYRARARAGRLSQRAGQRFDSLAAIAAAAQIRFDPGLRDEAIACLALPDLRVLREWDGWPAGSDSFDVSDGMGVYVRTDLTGAASVRRVADDTEVCQVPGSGSRALARLSPDGRYLTLGSPDERQLALWRVDGPAPVKVVAVQAAAWDLTPDGRHLAVVKGRRLIQYDVETGREAAAVACDLLVIGVPLAFDPTGPRFAAPDGAAVRVRDLGTGAVLGTLSNPARVNDLAWQPGGDKVAAACDDGRIYLWDVGRQELVRVLEGHRNAGLLVAFNRRGDRLVSNGWEGVARVWDVATGRQVLSVPCGVGVRFERTDPYLIERAGTNLRVWELAPGREYRTLVRREAGAGVRARAVAVGPDRRLLAVATEEGWGLWDLTDGSERAFDPQGFTGFAAFDADGAILTHGRMGTARWPAAGPGRFGPPVPLPVPGSFHLAALGGGGRVPGFPTGAGADVHLPDQVVRVGPHADTRRVAVAPDGRWAATSSYIDGSVKVWELPSGRPVRETEKTGNPGLVAVSPDGRWLGAAGIPFRVWQVDPWRETAVIDEADWQFALAFSPDGSLLAVETGKGVVRLLDPASGKEYARLADPNQDPVIPVFGPDGTVLFGLGAQSQTIHVWDLRAIRRQLAEIGLDWELPAYPPADPEPDVAPRPLDVRIDRAGPTAPPAAKPTTPTEDGLRLPTVRLRLSGASPAEAVQALARQSGIALGYDAGRGGTARRVTLDLDGVPFWEALDRLCAAAGLSYHTTARGLRLTDGRAPATAPVTYAGPFRIEAQSVRYEKTVPFQKGGPPNEQATVFLTVSTVPGPRLLGVGSIVEQLAAEDAAGRALAVTRWSSGYDEDPVRSGGRFTRVVVFRTPADRAAGLKVLRGALSAEVMVRPRAVVEVGGLDRAGLGGATGPGGVRLAVQPGPPARGQVTLQVTLTGPPGWQYDPRAYRFELQDAAGRGTWALVNDLPAQPAGAELAPDHLGLFASAPTAGLPGALPWGSLPAATKPLVRRFRYAGPLTFYPADDRGPPARLILHTFDRARVEVPFEFRDLPLP